MLQYALVHPLPHLDTATWNWIYSWRMSRIAIFVVAPILAGSSLPATPVIGKTVPVGIVKLGDTAVGEPSVQANTDVRISIPFLKAATLRGTVSSITGSTVTFSSSSSAAALSEPQYLVIESGSKAGLIALVNSSTYNSVTVITQPDDALTGITSDDLLSLRPAWTLGNLFSEEVPHGTYFLGWSGTHTGINPSTDVAFQCLSGTWFNSGYADASNTVLFPNEVFILRSPSGAQIPFLSVCGEVSTVPSRAYILNTATTGRDNPVSYLSAVNEPLLSSGLSAAVSLGDQLYFYDNNSPGVNKSGSPLWFYAGVWYDSEFNVLSNFDLEAGNGYMIRRASSSSMTPTLWSDLPDYLPF